MPKSDMISRDGVVCALPLFSSGLCSYVPQQFHDLLVQHQKNRHRKTGFLLNLAEA